MSDIRVVNKYHLGNRPTQPPEGVRRVTIMRGTPLGNPFVMKDASQSERNRVCDAYEEWLGAKILEEGSQLKQFNTLLAIAKEPDCETLELVCCCAPKRCHGDTIKRLLEQRL